MKPFLTRYQYTKPLMPFMYDDLHQLLRDILSRYIKPETLETCKSASILCDVNFSDAKNNLRNKEVDSGFDVNKILADKMKIDETIKREIDVFTADCLKFLESLTSTFVEKSPLKYAVVQNGKSLNPEIMCTTHEKGTKHFKSLDDNLVKLDRGTPKEEDGIYAEYKQYLEMVAMKNCQLFLKFNRREDRLNEFFFLDVGGLSDHPKLSKAIKMILVLFYGQGWVEIGFNVNKDMSQPNLEDMSLISLRGIYDHLVSNDLSPQSIIITKELRDSVRRARIRQRMDLAERNK